MFATTIFLNSTHECFGDRYVFQCTVTGPGILLWVIESINTFDTNDIVFDVANKPGVVTDNYPEVFNVTLISAVRSPDHPLLGNLTSEITVLVTSNTLGKRVYCSDGRHREEGSPSITIFGCKLIL